MKNWYWLASICAVGLFTFTVVWLQRDDGDTHSSAAEYSLQPIKESAAKDDLNFPNPDSKPSGLDVTKLPLSTDMSTNDESSSANKLTSDEAIKRTREAVLNGIRRLYGDFAVKAGLSPAEADSFIAVLVDQDMQLRSGEPAVVTDLPERYKKWLESRDAAIRSQLGSQRAAEFAIYEKSVGARQEVDEIGRELNRATLPLTEEQRASLIDAAVKNKGFSTTSNPFSGNSLGADLQQMSAQMQLRDQSMLVVARGVLSSEQYAQYEKFQTQRRDSLEAALRREDERDQSSN
jgi:hypothetical protein